MSLPALNHAGRQVWGPRRSQNRKPLREPPTQAALAGDMCLRAGPTRRMDAAIDAPRSKRCFRAGEAGSTQGRRHNSDRPPTRPAAICPRNMNTNIWWPGCVENGFGDNGGHGSDQDRMQGPGEKGSHSRSNRQWHLHFLCRDKPNLSLSGRCEGSAEDARLGTARLLL